MQESNQNPEKPVGKNQKYRSLKGAFLVLLPSIIILLGFSLAILPEPFAGEDIAAFMLFNLIFSLIGSKMIFEDLPWVVLFTIFFMGLNVVISFFIGCVATFRL